MATILVHKQYTNLIFPYDYKLFAFALTNYL